MNCFSFFLSRKIYLCKTMEVEIISRENIKPSSSTPLHLKTYNISLLDQSAPPIYVPLILYYPNPMNDTTTTTTRLRMLKQSLSETLTLFYPFAGKVKDKLSIDCNDEGVYFVEARVKNNIPLSEFLTHPPLSSISKFLPGEASITIFSTPGKHLLMIQVTTFPCGGIVIATRFSHMITDGTGMSTFLKTWAAKTQGVEKQCRPNFDASSVLFPQRDPYPSEATDKSMITPFFKRGRCVTSRFVFDASTLATLKAKVATNSSSRVTNPTSVEVVTALLFKCIMGVLKAKYSTFKPACFSHAVNLRPRAVPSLSEYSIGNIFWTTAALCTDEEPELHDVVWKMRQAITKVNKDFVMSLQGDGGLLSVCEAFKDVGGVYSGAVDRIGFTSWRRFGSYDIDFGWGKPLWVSCVSSSDKADAMFLYFITLMDTRSGGGIEAWVYLDEQDIAILHHDKELLAFAKINPSPLA